MVSTWLCWGGDTCAFHKEGTEALCPYPQPPDPALGVASIWLFLSWLFYNKTIMAVTMSLVSSVIILVNYRN